MTAIKIVIFQALNTGVVEVDMDNDRVINRSEFPDRSAKDVELIDRLGISDFKYIRQEPKAEIGACQRTQYQQ